MKNPITVKVRREEIGGGFKSIEPEVRAGAIDGLNAVGLAMLNSAKRRIQKGPASGRTYEKYGPRRTHKASAPGEPPATDTGGLVNSGFHEIDEPALEVAIGFAKFYAAFLEYGTRLMAKRPFLLPTVGGVALQDRRGDQGRDPSEVEKMSEPGFELQRAMVAAIRADATLIALLGNPVRVYDHVPENAPLPYIAHDAPGSSEWDVTPTETDEGYGAEHSIMLHAWSAYEGKKQIGAMLYALEVLFRDWQPALTGHRLVNIRYVSSDRLRDPDGQAYHGVIMFRAVTEEL